MRVECKYISKHLYAAADLLRKNNEVTKLAVIGFCWGASIALRSGQVRIHLVRKPL